MILQFILQVIPIPVYYNGNSDTQITDENVKTYIGILILMNIAFIMSLVFSTIRYYKEKRENQYVRYFYRLFMGNDFMLLALLNMSAFVVDGIIIVTYLGHLIGNLL